MTSRYSSEITCSVAETPQDTPYRDASRHRMDTPDGYADLAEINGWGLWIIFFPTDVSLSITEFY